MGSHSSTTPSGPASSRPSAKRLSALTRRTGMATQYTVPRPGSSLMLTCSSSDGHHRLAGEDRTREERTGRCEGQVAVEDALVGIHEREHVGACACSAR